MCTAACAGPSPGDGDAIAEDCAIALYADVSDSHLPLRALGEHSMDARPADLDADGDLDLVVAVEFGRNVLLLNDGAGRFRSDDRIPRSERDSEDVAIADLDGDGDLDVVVASEEDRTNELYLNDGSGGLVDASERVPVEGTSNAVLAADLNGDGSVDLLFGNNGQNALLINRGDARFDEETRHRLPPRSEHTQDLELGDADGDGDPDLLVGNEGPDRLLIDRGGGTFVDETEDRLPGVDPPDMTREADFGDVDGDGDLDILFANRRPRDGGPIQPNRLLINAGDGFFVDRSERLPAVADRSWDGDLADLDGDGDLDIITANNGEGGAELPYRVYLNDGSARFRDGTADVLPPGTVGAGFDIEVADFDGDGAADLYLASRGTTDRLLLRCPRRSRPPSR